MELGWAHTAAILRGPVVGYFRRPQRTRTIDRCAMKSFRAEASSW